MEAGAAAGELRIGSSRGSGSSKGRRGSIQRDRRWWPVCREGRTGGRVVIGTPFAKRSIGRKTSDDSEGCLAAATLITQMRYRTEDPTG